jgi:hypothetical protein
VLCVLATNLLPQIRGEIALVFARSFGASEEVNGVVEGGRGATLVSLLADQLPSSLKARRPLYHCVLALANLGQLTAATCHRCVSR